MRQSILVYGVGCTQPILRLSADAEQVDDMCRWLDDEFAAPTMMIHHESGGVTVLVRRHITVLGISDEEE